MFQKSKCYLQLIDQQINFERYNKKIEPRRIAKKYK